MAKRHGIRYIVNDVDASIEFYTQMLDFKIVMHPNSDFGMLLLDDLRLILVHPSGRSGAGQDMPDGAMQTPGGWNRISIEVDDLDSVVGNLSNAGCTFRNEIVEGVGGRQILLEDPLRESC